MEVGDLKVGEEEGRLVALDLAVLDGGAAQDAVELGRPEHDRAVVVERRVLADPKVDVVAVVPPAGHVFAVSAHASGGRRRAGGRAYRRPSSALCVRRMRKSSCE